MRSSNFDSGVLRHFSPNDRYLVGVSGGRDSVTLLHWLVERGYRRLIVCHLNHRLRGRAAAADATFVQRLADQLGCEFELGSADVRKLARDSKQSVETAGRNARYSFFASVARERRCRTVFVGHHADDLVETFLLNLFRGAGSHGLRAMREASVRLIDDFSLTIVRPLLRIWREEIDNYVAKQKIRFREDETNRELVATRNRIRRRILPFIERELGRDVRKSIWRAAMIAGEENATRLICGEQLPVADLRELPTAQQRRALHAWLHEQGIADVGFDLVERIREIADPESRTAKLNLPRGRHVRRRAGKLFIE